MLKPLLLLPAVLLSGLLPASAQQKTTATHKAAAAPAADTPKPPDSAVRAKEIYKFDCAICHGETGNGKTDLATSMSLTLDDWTNPATLSAKSDQDLFDTIRKGKDKMPPEDPSRAKDSEIRSLVEYIRTFSKGQPAAPIPAAAPAAAPAPAPSPSPTSR